MYSIYDIDLIVICHLSIITEILDFTILVLIVYKFSSAYTNILQYNSIVSIYL